jgi:hypothetical protein
MRFIPIYTYFILLCFIISLSIYVSKAYNFFYLKLFPPFLLLTLIAEVYGSYLSYSSQNNLYLYNFFTIFEFCFYLIILLMIIENKKIRKIIIISCVFYPLISVLNVFFFQGPESFHSITHALGCLLVSSFCIYYFLELFRQPKSIKLTRSPAFWICSGLLFFYCCSFPLFGLLNIWATVPIVIDHFTQIVAILNVFLYTLFTIAFLCIRTRKYTLSL